MTIEEFDKIQKEYRQYYDIMLDLNKSITDIIDDLIGHYKKFLEIIKIDPTVTADGPTLAVEFTVNKNDYMVFQMYKKGTQNIYNVLGFDNPPQDCYPEYTIYNGFLTEDMFNAFNDYMCRITGKKLKPIEFIK
jgi:hypothetical protein